MDACSCHDVRSALEILTKSVQGVEGVDGVRLRKLGPYIVGDIAVVVDSGMSVGEANLISERVEEKARSLFDEIHEIVVSFKPAEKGQKNT